MTATKQQVFVRTIKGLSPVFDIIQNDDECSINALMHVFFATGASVDSKIDTLNNTALHFATVLNRVHIVKYLLNESANVNEKNDDGETPLQLAIKSNNIPITKLLLDNGGNLNQENVFGLTGFMLSIECGSLEMIKFLIDYGADIHKCCKLAGRNGETLRPLELAVRLLKVEVVQLLLQHGVEVNQYGIDILLLPFQSLRLSLVESPLNNINKVKAERISELLVEYGMDLNAKDQSGSTPLLLAIKARYFDLVEYLIKAGCDLNTPDAVHSSHHTPIQLIILVSGKRKMVELMLRYGADYKILNSLGFTAYHLSLENHPHYNFPTVQVFWQYGCPYDLPLSPDRNGSIMDIPNNTEMRIKDIVQCQKLLFDGIKMNDVNTVEKALKSGAVARGTSMDIKYPLHFVSSKGYTSIGKVLLENGIKVNNLNDESKTALQLAIKYRKTSICKLLFQHGACLNFKEEIRKLDASNDATCKEIKDLLMSIYVWFSLVKVGNFVIFELMKELLKTDEEMFLVHLNALDKNKRSLMASAMYYGHGEIVEGIMKNRLHCKSKTFRLSEH